MADHDLADIQTIESKFMNEGSDRSIPDQAKLSPRSQSSIHENTQKDVNNLYQNSNSPNCDIPLNAINSSEGPSDYEQTPKTHFIAPAIPEGGTPHVGGEGTLSGLALLKRNSLRLQGYKVPERAPLGSVGSFAEEPLMEDEGSGSKSVDSKKSFMSKIGPGGRKRKRRKGKDKDNANGDKASMSSVKAKPPPTTNLDELRAKLEVIFCSYGNKKI